MDLSLAIGVFFIVYFVMMGGSIAFITYFQTNGMVGWDSQISKWAKIIWNIVFLVIFMPALLFFGGASGFVGSLSLVVAMLLASNLGMLSLDLVYLFPRRLARKMSGRHSQPLDERMQTYVGLTPPNWMGEIGQRGWGDYSVDSESRLRNPRHEQGRQKGLLERLSDGVDKLGKW